MKKPRKNTHASHSDGATTRPETPELEGRMPLPEELTGKASATDEDLVKLFDDKEREAFLKTEQGKKAIVQRFKGLGEMNAEELWETTMNPTTRRLKKINIEDAAQADEVFTMLMGDEVAPRKRFIQTHSKLANIDVT